MSNAQDGFKAYFEKMINAWQRQFGSRPKIPFDDEQDSDLFVSTPDEENMIEWLPCEVDKPSLSNRIDDCELSDQVVEYFDAYRFLAAGGRVREFAIQLTPITTRFLRDEFSRQLATYKSVHGGVALASVPIGVESKTGKLVVLDNSGVSAAVSIEDDETHRLTRIADSPFEFLIRLEP